MIPHHFKEKYMTEPIDGRLLGLLDYYCSLAGFLYSEEVALEGLEIAFTEEVKNQFEALKAISNFLSWKEKFSISENGYIFWTLSKLATEFSEDSKTFQLVQEIQEQVRPTNGLVRA